ncbi:polysaccharide export protein [Edwardsiella piscicida]|nr:polysaccharide export protein [Edwardsiella piscicida]ELM3729492.1 polysaccharide export protein [Edwardsiella piscicida]ELV7537062.1 polysaccharide export protein [Edwardsiella piscicida]
MKWIKRNALLLVGCLLTACSSTPPLQDPPDPQPRYLLGAGDTVNILVAGEPEMSMRLTLDSSGTLNFPYIGTLTLCGKTPQQVALELTERLRGDYLRQPMVTVSVAQFRDFFILGQVKRPDGYAYQPGLTVEKALALAGGFTDRADHGDLSIRQAGSDRLLKNVAMTHRVQPSDTVIVGMSFF